MSAFAIDLGVGAAGINLNLTANSPYIKHRLGGWMPRDPSAWRGFLKRTCEQVRSDRKKKTISREMCHASVRHLWDLIEKHADVRMLFTLMLEQVPITPPYNTNPTGGPEFRDWKEMLFAFDYQLSQGPIWLFDTKGQMGLVGFPFNAFLDWPMGTPAGISAFLRPDINKCIRDMLNEYGQFLKSPASASVLSDSPEGWFNQTALQAMSEVADPPPVTMPFAEIFKCDPSAPAYGFKSWDDFFIRKFREGMRPVYMPNDNNAIVNACESGPLTLQTGVKLVDSFWLKGQPYSLVDMFNGDHDVAAQFDGGTVYQAFLSALSYHCWHAPVSGTVKKIVDIPGTYYAENYWAGFADGTDGPPDAAGPDQSQKYICQVAARSLIFIQADNPAIGLMAMMVIGMAEVSTCEWTVKAGDHITKGDGIGMFHFGGSTHCLIFRPGVNLEFVPQAQNPGGSSSNLPVCGKLATVLSK